MSKIRRSHNLLIFNMGISHTWKDGLYIEMGPWFHHYLEHKNNKYIYKIWNMSSKTVSIMSPWVAVDTIYPHSVFVQNLLHKILEYVPMTPSWHHFTYGIQNLAASRWTSHIMIDESLGSGLWMSIYLRVNFICLSSWYQCHTMISDADKSVHLWVKRFIIQDVYRQMFMSW